MTNDGENLDWYNFEMSPQVQSSKVNIYVKVDNPFFKGSFPYQSDPSVQSPYNIIIHWI